jgi:hypothetical protein
MVSTGQSESVEANGGGLRTRIGGLDDTGGVIVEGGWPTAASPAADTAGAPVGHTTVVCEELPLPSLAAMVAAMAITATSNPAQIADSTTTRGVKVLAGGGAALALAPSTSIWSNCSDTGPADMFLSLPQLRSEKGQGKLESGSCTPRALRVHPDAMMKDVEEASAQEVAEAKKATWATGLVAFTLVVVVIVLGVLVVAVANRDDTGCTVHLPTDLYPQAEAPAGTPAGTHAPSTSLGYPGASALRHARAHKSTRVSCRLDIVRVSRQRGGDSGRKRKQHPRHAICFRRFRPPGA